MYGNVILIHPHILCFLDRVLNDRSVFFISTSNITAGFMIDVQLQSFFSSHRITAACKPERQNPGQIKFTTLTLSAKGQAYCRTR